MTSKVKEGQKNKEYQKAKLKNTLVYIWQPHTHTHTHRTHRCVATARRDVAIASVFELHCVLARRIIKYKKRCVLSDSQSEGALLATHEGEREKNGGIYFT